MVPFERSTYRPRWKSFHDLVKHGCLLTSQTLQRWNGPMWRIYHLLKRIQLSNYWEDFSLQYEGSMVQVVCVEKIHCHWRGLLPLRQYAQPCWLQMHGDNKNKKCTNQNHKTNMKQPWSGQKSRSIAASYTYQMETILISPNRNKGCLQYVQNMSIPAWPIPQDIFRPPKFPHLSFATGGTWPP